MQLGVNGVADAAVMTDLDLDGADMTGLDLANPALMHMDLDLDRHHNSSFLTYGNHMDAQLAQQQQQQQQQAQAQAQAQVQQQQQQQQNSQRNGTEPASNTGNSMSGPGAGLLPTGFGAPPVANGASTLNEFTKRRNWSQRILEELKDFLHILTPDGRITYASPSSEQLTGYKQEELVGKFVAEFIHQDDNAIFVREFNESIASGNMLRLFYRFRKADSTYMIFETVGHPHLTSEQNPSVPRNAAGYCRGFFMMGRPYPAKNASLLDSFLEHKIENERLTRRIAELKKEEREEDEAQQRQMMTENTTSGNMTESRGGDSEQTPTTATRDQTLMPPPAKPTLSNMQLTRENLHDATASFKQDSINDKMARYEGATHLETIEMLTGLRYRDGERSKGISTGDASPTLIRGDVGIAISADKDGRGGDKKKKLKVADEYVCTDCGTLDSPEWRKGPSGPKTLCNACGLRWAKKEKKRTTPLSGPPPSLPQGNSGGST
ncbi:blue light receptor [Thelotrema lepadinum]|nr:blue light receptor [Thelotrema lepadinum]